MRFITNNRRLEPLYGSSCHTSPDCLQKFRVSIVDGNVLGQATDLVPDVIMKHPDYSKHPELEYLFCFHVSFLQECYRQLSYRPNTTQTIFWHWNFEFIGNEVYRIILEQVIFGFISLVAYWRYGITFFQTLR